MHPRIHEILESLDTNRGTLEQALAEVPDDLRTRRPAEGRWSVAEILEHLVIVEGRVLALVETHLSPDMIAGIGREQETDSVFLTIDTAGLVDRSRPLVAGEQSQPRTGMSIDESWRELVARRRRVKEMVRAADGAALGSITIPHPRLGALNLYQWLVFLGSHEARHAAQIREVAAALSSTAHAG
jgi:uncharacterized damage-inducible protein DinB